MEIFIGLIGGLVGFVGAMAGIGAVVWGLGYFEYLGGKRKSAIHPLDKKALIDRIFSLNSPDLPYQIRRGDDTDLVVEWKIVDARWYGIFSKERIKETYQAYILADGGRHTVRYYEELGAVEWNADTPKATFQKQFFKGRVLYRKSWGVQYGIKEDSTVGKVYKYKFDINVVRDPIKKFVEDSGWEFVSVIRKRHATYN